jgi:precorrin-2 dehydrogenase/sirohydrochlorin ferrochelatase
MRYYPVNLDVKDRRCLVVGGGAVGLRKVRTLLSCGARVTVVSPEAGSALQELAATGKIIWHRRDYRAADLEETFLVIGATDSEAINQQISSDALSRNVLCNIADRPAACNFILPAIIAQGDLVLTVSTSGKSPAFARHLRKELEGQFGQEYKTLLELMGAIRSRLLAEAHAPEAHKPLFEGLIKGGLLARIRERDTNGVNRLLFDILGEGYEVERLIHWHG